MRKDTIDPSLISQNISGRSEKPKDTFGWSNRCTWIYSTPQYSKEKRVWYV